MDKTSEFFGIMNERGIKYVHFKSNEHLYAGLEGDTDIDILISTKDAEKVARILRNIGYIHSKETLDWHKNDTEHWFAVGSNGKLAHIHIYHSLRTGKSCIKEYTIDLFDEAFCYSHTSEEYGLTIQIVDPDYEAFLLLIRTFLKSYIWKKPLWMKGFRYFAKEDTTKEWDYLLERASVSSIFDFANTIFERHCGEGCSIDSLVDEKSLSFFVPDICRKIAGYSVIRDSLSSIMSIFALVCKRIVGYMWSIWPRPIVAAKKRFPIRGAVVAIMGTDGTGKSTVTRDLVGFFGNKFVVKRIYMGSGTGYNSIYKTAKRFALKLIKNDDKGDKKISELKSRRSFVSFAEEIGNIQVAIKNYRNIKWSQRAAQKGYIIICDRYPQSYVWGMCDGPKNSVYATLKRIENALFNKMNVYKPDMVVKLFASEDCLKERRHDDDICNLLNKQRAILNDILFEGTNSVLIDTDCDYLDEMTQIERFVWNELRCLNE